MRTFLVAVGPGLVGSSVGIGVPFGLMYGSSFVVLWSGAGGCLGSCFVSSVECVVVCCTSPATSRVCRGLGDDIDSMLVR